MIFLYVEEFVFYHVPSTTFHYKQNQTNTNDH